MEHLQRKYHVINDHVALFDEEYYISVFRLPVDSFAETKRAELFDLLYAFEHKDVELEIDVSEEEKGVWYLQVLVPYMLTLGEAAIRRIRAGGQALEAYLDEHGIKLVGNLLSGEEIYAYVKRYNPHLVITS